MRLLYTTLLYIAAPLVLFRLLWKSRRQPEYRGRLAERFGFVERPPQGVAVWVHAVSVGEALASLPLIRALIVRHGEGRIWVTTTTPTGSARISAALGERVRHSYVPYDLPGAVERFITRVRPQQLVVMETELWPNLFHACRRRRIPLTVANARLSPRSFRGYSRVPGFVRQTLADCSAIAAQSAADADRFLQLGAAPERTSVIGNLKFDLTIPDADVAEGRHLRELMGNSRPVWIAASTHDGEEAAALAAHVAILEIYPDAALILVPRHPQRFDSVWRLLEDSGLSIERRGRAAALAKSGHPQNLSQIQVFLGDTMGEMYAYLSASDVAFVGGSLVDIGGHNVLEPAAMGKPVLFGPYMHNFAPARELLLERKAALEVENGPALASELAELLGDQVARSAMGRAGEAAVAGNRGALTKLLDVLDLGLESDPRFPASPAS